MSSNYHKYDSRTCQMCVLYHSLIISRLTELGGLIGHEPRVRKSAPYSGNDLMFVTTIRLVNTPFTPFGQSGLDREARDPVTPDGRVSAYNS